MRKSVVFDIGETILDDTREFGAWADWLAVPRHTFSAVFGAIVLNGGTCMDVFNAFRPGFDLEYEYGRRVRAGRPLRIEVEDLYGDVIPCLESLRRDGHWVALAGNQQRRVGDLIRSLGLPVDSVVTSAELGFEKPDLEFFRRVSAMAATCHVVYVGDNPVNDIEAARDVGMETVRVIRGPFGYVTTPATTAKPDHTVRTLRDLPLVLRG